MRYYHIYTGIYDILYVSEYIVCIWINTEKILFLAPLRVLNLGYSTGVLEDSIYTILAISSWRGYVMLLLEFKATFPV